MTLKQRLKAAVNRGLRPLGLEVRRIGSRDPRATMGGALEHARRLGLAPQTVIDVGAAMGTPVLYEAFPEARHLLIEPLTEYVPYLERIVNALPRAEYILAAAAAQPGEVTIHVHPNLQGSSLYALSEPPGVAIVPRTVPAVTLDGVCAERGLPGPYLIKVDVQGAELDVLAGASSILNETEYVVLEVSLFKFLVEGPQLHDVVAYMKASGFVVYDLLGTLYRPLDGALAQMDMAFVRENGLFRQHLAFATTAQLEALYARHTERYRRALNSK